MGEGTGRVAEELSPQGLMLIPSQREAKWLATGGLTWVFVLKPRAPVTMWVMNNSLVMSASPPSATTMALHLTHLPVPILCVGELSSSVKKGNGLEK